MQFGFFLNIFGKTHTINHSHNNSTVCCKLKYLNCLLSSNQWDLIHNDVYVVIEAHYLWNLSMWLLALYKLLLLTIQTTQIDTLYTHCLYYYICFCFTFHNNEHTDHLAMVFDPKNATTTRNKQTNKKSRLSKEYSTLFDEIAVHSSMLYIVIFVWCNC